MFVDSLRTLPDVLEGFQPGPPAADRASWLGLPDSVRAQLLADAEDAFGRPYPPLHATAYLQYSWTGERATFEASYFGRRRMLNAMILAECVEHQGRADFNADISVEEDGRAYVRTPTDLSAIVDLAATAQRIGRAHKALPNTNLIVARTLVPQLRGAIAPGVTVLATAAMALNAGAEAEAALLHPPQLPDLAELEAAIARSGVEVSAIQVPERF